MRAIYRKMRNAHYIYIKRNVEKVWGARYTLGALYLSKNTVITTIDPILITTPFDATWPELLKSPLNKPQTYDGRNN